MYCNVNGVWKNSDQYLNIGGAWKSKFECFVNVGGVWRKELIELPTIKMISDHVSPGGANNIYPTYCRLTATSKGGSGAIKSTTRHNFKAGDVIQIAYKHWIGEPDNGMSGQGMGIYFNDSSIYNPYLAGIMLHSESWCTDKNGYMKYASVTINANYSNLYLWVTLTDSTTRRNTYLALLEVSVNDIIIYP